MPSNSLKDEFGNDFAATAFQIVDNEPRIIGRFGSISRFDDGSYDCWFHSPDLSPLSGHKLAAIERKASQKHHFVRLTGEAYAVGEGREFVLDMSRLIGVRKRRSISAAERERLKAQVAKARDCKRHAA